MLYIGISLNIHFEGKKKSEKNKFGCPKAKSAMKRPTVGTHMMLPHPLCQKVLTIPNESLFSPQGFGVFGIRPKPQESSFYTAEIMRQSVQNDHSEFLEYLAIVELDIFHWLVVQ